MWFNFIKQNEIEQPKIKKKVSVGVSKSKTSQLEMARFFSYIPGMTKNTSHTISIYGKMLVIHLPYKSIRTENCMKGL